MIVLVGGGARSGKSRFALGRAESLGRERVFVATAQACDAEMRARIATHQRERGERFRTLEAPRDLPDALAQLSEPDVAVVDCLTGYLSTLLLDGAADSDVEQHVQSIMTACRGARCHVVIVTNEVGLGLVPATPLGRRFRDIAGRAHQHVAARADEIYLCALGVVLRLKPGPVAIAETGAP